MVRETMLKIDRGDFCSYYPYTDSPQPIQYNATISAPHMHAYALELLKDKLQGAKSCLDVGSGSGYLTLGRILKFKGAFPLFLIQLSNC